MGTEIWVPTKLRNEIGILIVYVYYVYIVVYW